MAILQSFKNWAKGSNIGSWFNFQCLLSFQLIVLSFLLKAYKIRFFFSIKTQIQILVSLQVVFKGGEFSKHLFHFCSNDLRATLSDTSRLVHHCF